jgi:hypothetical protein
MEGQIPSLFLCPKDVSLPININLKREALMKR